jgi:hypothetical protein
VLEAESLGTDQQSGLPAPCREWERVSAVDGVGLPSLGREASMNRNPSPRFRISPARHLRTNLCTEAQLTSLSLRETHIVQRAVHNG